MTRSEFRHGSFIDLTLEKGRVMLWCSNHTDCNYRPVYQWSISSTAGVSGNEIGFLCLWDREKQTRSTGEWLDETGSKHDLATSFIFNSSVYPRENKCWRQCKLIVKQRPVLQSAWFLMLRWTVSCKIVNGLFQHIVRAWTLVYWCLSIQHRTAELRPKHQINSILALESWTNCS